ncbi:hypothetical protein AYI69_g4926, partial [Smittium culicis]
MFCLTLYTMLFACPILGPFLRKCRLFFAIS